MSRPPVTGAERATRRAATRVLASLAVVAVAAVTAVLTASAAPPANPGSGAPGNANGQLGLVGMDHVGITVPDIDEAVAWFENVMGCVAPLTFGPFSGVQDLLDVDPLAVVQQITMVRCGRSANEMASPSRSTRLAAGAAAKGLDTSTGAEACPSDASELDDVEEAEQPSCRL